MASQRNKERKKSKKRRLNQPSSQTQIDGGDQDVTGDPSTASASVAKPSKSTSGSSDSQQDGGVKPQPSGSSQQGETHGDQSIEKKRKAKKRRRNETKRENKSKPIPSSRGGPNGGSSASPSTSKSLSQPHPKESQSSSTATEIDTAKPSAKVEHAFVTDESDHCETPMQAYRDALPLIDKLIAGLSKTRKTVTVYDPYYCNGGIQTKLASLRFANVINQNRDFYGDIADDTVPEHDILVTNPPYSGVHIERLLKFAMSSGKPFLLLLPHFVYTKEYYRGSMQGHGSKQIFFLVPKARYSYVPPAWASHAEGSTALAKGKTQTAPFPTFWYCHVPTNVGIGKDWLQRTFGRSGVYDRHRKLQYASCAQDIPRDFKGEFDKTKKRPNNKARKRAAARRRKEQEQKQNERR